MSADETDMPVMPAVTVLTVECELSRHEDCRYRSRWATTIRCLCPCHRRVA